MIMPTTGQMDQQAGLVQQHQQASTTLQAGQFSGINNTIITQPGVVSGIDSSTGQGIINQA